VFLESKVQTPAASRNFLIRERLIQRLDTSRERLVIVSAGMGYGKTVLLTHFAKRYPDRCAWYHLDRTDNDIMAFVSYLSRSVARVVPTFEVDFSPYLQLEQNEALVRNLALDFAAAFRALGGREVCLVLDDFQVLESEWVFLFLSILWESDHGALRLFLCTKSAPPAFCAKYLMEQSAAVLGADSLSFNLEEIRLLARDYAPPEQLDAVARAIQSRIEGWPAGVSFALLYFRQRQCRMTEQELEQACQQRYLQDYFMHELFRKLPFELQHFLTFTSVLTYLRPDVCNALAGIDNAAGQLAYLEQENLFILRLSGGGRIYRYHSLFRNFLVGQLQPEQRTRLLEQASDFYLRAPEKAQAAEYAIACGDGARLQSAVEAAGPEVLSQGQLDTLRRWLEELRRLGTPPSPELLILEAQYRERTGDWREALDLADQAVAQAPGQAGERCWLEARLLWARVTREQVSVKKSLEILDGLRSRLGPERAALRALRRQAMELRVYDLLDLGEYSSAMEQVLDGLEKSSLRRDGWELRWQRELAALCFFSAGDYRRAMKMCVVLRADGASGLPADLVNLYLALSGRARQARERIGRTAEELPEDAHCYTSEILLMRILTERLGELESGGETPPLREESRAPWDSEILWSRFPALRVGSLGPALRRALSGEPMEPAEEEALFAQDAERFTMLQDGARWLAARGEARRGNRDRALELCRRTRAARGAWGAGPQGGRARLNAFVGFAALEEALLSPQAEANALMARCAPYLLNNHLICPGLTKEEAAAAEKLLTAHREETSSPLPPDEESAAQSGPPCVTVKCFGRLHVLLPDGQELRWRTRKAQEIFAYLFHLNGAPADREQLMDLLWPQAAPGNATSLFHTSLYSIRKTLAAYGLDGLIQREQRSYRMDMSLVRSPREQVDALCRGEDAQSELTALYEGPYLEDVEAPWAEDSRAWYAGAFLHACRAQAARCMDGGDFPAAAEYLRAAAREEPYDETVAGQLIRCYAAMGETKNAIAQYNRLKDALHAELNTEPGEEVRSIYEEYLLKRLSSGRSKE
jgi:DNA-binding SARP family transcriptional activator